MAPNHLTKLQKYSAPALEKGLDRRALRPYWDRACMGIRWRRRFPDAPKTELREFLTIFVDAFCFDHKRRTCFSPDDRVMEIYRADYPPGSLGDSMELETLGLSLKKRYGIDFTAVWREDITLGELYASILGSRI